MLQSLSYHARNSHTDLNKIGWPSQQSGNKKIAERSKCVYVQSTQCNLGVPYPSHSVQICRSNKTIPNRQRTMLRLCLVKSNRTLDSYL
jgi:hypothetical protein